jgi:uncharacterized membrane protein
MIGEKDHKAGLFLSLGTPSLGIFTSNFSRTALRLLHNTERISNVSMGLFSVFWLLITGLKRQRRKIVLWREKILAAPVSANFSLQLRQISYFC